MRYWRWVGLAPPRSAETTLAFLAGAGTFALGGVVLSGIESDVLVGLVGVPFVAAIVAVAQSWGVAYAVPIAMAGMLAFDWFSLPPTHALEFPDSANLADVLVYLAVAVLIGQLAAQAARRAEVSERARGAIADEQAALRRVATLVAKGVPAGDLFAAVAEEAGTLLEVDAARIFRYEDGEIVHLGGWSTSRYDPPSFDRAKLEGTSVAADVLRTGRVARIDDFESIEARAPFTQGLGVKSVVGAPIVVEGRRWGLLVAWSTGEALPADAEARLTDFTELMATAISNTAARGALGLLAEEQAALRRVATLVARGVAPSETFAAVVRELGLLLGVSSTHMGRYEPDATATSVGGWSADGTHVPIGIRDTLDDTSAIGLVFASGAPARINNYGDTSSKIVAMAQELGIRSSVAAPVVVNGQLWGAMVASSNQDHPLPAGTEARIAAFAELAATAISNTEARAETGRLAEEQAALRHVATLVARAVPPGELFAAVAEEVGRLLGTHLAGMARYERDDTLTVLAAWASEGEHPLVPGPWPLEGGDLASTISRTGRPVRIDDYHGVPGRIAAFVRDELGIVSSVGSPIVVEGRLWGALFVHSTQADPLPADAESRLMNFAELVATAMLNAQARAELAASRARIVATTDQTRRRFERDLHDGVQQRLVSLSLSVRAAETMIPAELQEPRAQLSQVADELTGALDDLRELSRGIHPAILSEGGLGPALKALGRRSAVPVELDVSVDKRLDERVEVTAYYVVSEALANTAKHAQASVAEIQVQARNGILDLTIHDNGIGGADPGQGSGLTGLTDRVQALGGTITIASPTGQGTSLHVELPDEGS